jgi:hypothetical protein
MFLTLNTMCNCTDRANVKNGKVKSKMVISKENGVLK